MTLYAPRPTPPTRTNKKSLSRISFVFVLGMIAASAVNGAIIKFALHVADASSILSWWESITIGFAWIAFRFVDSILFSKT